MRPVVAALARRLDAREPVAPGGAAGEAVRAVGPEARAPRAAEGGVVLLEEARDVLALRVVVLDEDGEVRHDLPLHGDGAGPGPRVLEVLVEGEDGRVVRRPLARLRRQQVRVGRRGDAEAVEEARAEGVLGPRAVRGARGGEVQARDAGVEEPAVQPHDRLPVALGVPGDPHAGLPHLVVRGDGAVGGEAEGAVAVGDGLADEAAVEDLVGRGDRVRLLLHLPAQAVLDGQLRGWAATCPGRRTRARSGGCPGCRPPRSSGPRPRTAGGTAAAGPVMLAPAGHAPASEVEPSEHST